MTVYTDAQKADYVNQALAKGYAQADIDQFLTNNPGDYGRLLSGLAPQSGASVAALLAPTSPDTGLGDLGAPSVTSDGFLTAHLVVSPFAAPAAAAASVVAPAAAAVPAIPWLWLAIGAAVIMLLARD